MTIADNAVTLGKMAGLARGNIIVGDISGDPSALAAGAVGKILVASTDGDPSWTTLSGDATLSAGVLTIATLNQDTSGLAATATALASTGSLIHTGDIAVSYTHLTLPTKA